MPHARRIVYPVDQIREAIARGETQQQIADRLSKEVDPRITAKLIYKVCRKHAIECQRTGPRAGEGHPEWSGGRLLCKNGYVKVFCPEHPTCQRVNQNRKKKTDGYYRKSKYVWEHRLVMEQHLGRFLLPEEVVHHINGNPADNRPENLMLFQNNAEHLKHDLAGRCPVWTEDGLRRLGISVEKWRASGRPIGEPDAPKLRQKTRQLTEPLGALAPALS